MLKFSDFLSFAWTELSTEEFEIQIAIDAMKILIKKQESSWEEIKDQLKERIQQDAELNSLEDNDRSSYYEQFYSMDDETIREIKRFQRNAMLLSIFAFFEGRLKGICEKIENDNNLSVKLTKVTGNSDIEKYWNFLTQEYNINAVKVEPYFISIKQKKYARNIIAHHKGCISIRQKKKLVFEGLSTIPYATDVHQIEISNESFLTNLLDDISNFYKELLLAIDEKYKVEKGIKH